MKKLNLIVNRNQNEKKVTPPDESNGKPPEVAASVKSNGKPPEVAPVNPQKKLTLRKLIDKKTKSAPTTNGKPPTAAPDTSADVPNPFDPARYRLTQDFSQVVGTKKVITVVPCRPPNRHEWFRVRPGKKWHLQTYVFEDKIARETYLVEPALLPELGSETFPAILFCVVVRPANFILWRVRLPNEDGRSNAWNESALAAANLAKTRWVRMASDTKAGYYEVETAINEPAPPVWPDLSMSKILEIAFRGRLIDTLDHPVLKALRGEV